MGDNIGRGYLPGQELKVKAGDVCDTEGHEDIPAARRIVGETDSEGSETMCFCAECAAEYDAAPDSMAIGICDLCKCECDDLRPRRDRDEGFGGPVYYWCLECVRKDNAAAQAECDAYDRMNEAQDTFEYDEARFNERITEPPDDARGIVVRLATAEDLKVMTE